MKETDGVSRLVALTREAPREEKDQRPLRSYSNAVITDANRVRDLFNVIKKQCAVKFPFRITHSQIGHWL